MQNNSNLSLHGLHHVTAVTGNAVANVDFYTRVLGMRLVKKTVNQDDVSAYHLFYADELGSAGTDLTFFDWAGMRPAHNGAGTVTETGLRVLGDDKTLEAWADRFTKEGVTHGNVEGQFGLPTLTFRDAENQHLRLIAQPATEAEATGPFHPWKGSPLPLDSAIVSLGSVTLEVHNAADTADFLTEVLNFRADEKETGLYDTGPGGPGARLLLKEGLHRGGQGTRGVHHVAWRVKDSEALLAWQKQIEASGIGTSGQVNRHYFQSLYFRIPGGILFEIATDGPGFTADGEEASHLGERLALPPFLEPHRQKIEAGLTPLNYQPANQA